MLPPPPSFLLRLLRVLLRINIWAQCSCGGPLAGPAGPAGPSHMAGPAGPSSDELMAEMAMAFMEGAARAPTSKARPPRPAPSRAPSTAAPSPAAPSPLPGLSKAASRVEPSAPHRSTTRPSAWPPREEAEETESAETADLLLRFAVMTGTDPLPLRPQDDVLHGPAATSDPYEVVEADGHV